MLRTLSLPLSLSLLLSACTGMLEPGPGPDPGDPEPGTGNGDGDDPSPDPTALTTGEVDRAYHAAVQAALDGAAGATVADDGDRVMLGGTVQAGDASVRFTDLVLVKAPFAVSGTATVEVDAHVADIELTGGTTAVVGIDGVPAGTFIAQMPADDSFGEATAGLLLAEALDCQGPGLGGQDGVVTVQDSCTVDLGGQIVTLDVDLTIDLANLSIDGTIAVTGAGLDISLVFAGTMVEVTVNGELIATVDLGDLLGNLLQP